MQLLLWGGDILWMILIEEGGMEGNKSKSTRDVQGWVGALGGGGFRHRSREREREEGERGGVGGGI